MSQPTLRKYPTAFKERTVKLAVESEQLIAQTARDLGMHANTLHTWMGTYHRVERQEKQINDEHRFQALLRQHAARALGKSPASPLGSPYRHEKSLCLGRVVN